MCYRESDPLFCCSLGEGGCLRLLVCALFCPLLQRRAISSVVERLLHTQEVAGSNPASRILLFFAGNPKRHIRIEAVAAATSHRFEPLRAPLFLFAPEANNLQK